ncbi:MAG: hypothetical protein ACFFCS_29750 [Candidatus Hodarchaeota archaeon]
MSLKLTVRNSTKEDLNSNQVFVNKKLMEVLRLKIGDVVELSTETKKIGATLFYSSIDEKFERDCILLNKYQKMNLDVEVLDHVFIKGPLELQEAKYVHLLMLGTYLNFPSTRAILNFFKGRIITSNEVLVLPFSDGEIYFQVKEFLPKKRVVCFRPSTKLDISSKDVLISSIVNKKRAILGIIKSTKEINMDFIKSTLLLNDKEVKAIIFELIGEGSISADFIDGKFLNLELKSEK